MSESRLQYLFDQYISRSISPEEMGELMQLISRPENQAAVERMLDEMILNNKGGSGLNEESKSAILNAIFQAAPGKLVKMNKGFGWRKYAVAAAIILMVATGSYFLFFNKSQKLIAKTETQEQRFKNDVKPGGYKAKLTLADGRTIVLDSAAIGELTKQGGTAVINKDGQLMYSQQSAAGSQQVLYNTLSTAKGETYVTVLADGSKVWLNSASTIKYPVAFNGNERRVEITGEAYFEVKHNEAMPFIVSVNGMEVHDLGTEFNINAYTDEPVISTTLVQGSASVVKANKQQLLSPGQQAQVALRQAQGDIKLVNHADVVSATAWKNGIFKFNDAGIEQMMKQLARWYDVEIVYEGKVSDHFVVTIPRNVSMVNALKILEETGGAKFKVEGKKVTVTSP